MENLANEFIENRREPRLSGENRSESRLRYSWPIWFAENYDDILSQGQMVDVSSGGAAFTCYSDRCPHVGQEITTRFSVPSHGSDDPFALENFVRSGNVCRIDEISSYVRRVAIQFAEPLPFKPGEMPEEDTLVETIGEAMSELADAIEGASEELAVYP